MRSAVQFNFGLTNATWLIGCEPYATTILAGAGFLTPLSHPAQDSTKFFATETLAEFRRDEKWLTRATETASSRLTGCPARLEAQHDGESVRSVPSAHFDQRVGQIVRISRKQRAFARTRPFGYFL